MHELGTKKKLPRLLRVIALLNEYLPDRFPAIHDYDYMSENELHVWINNTYYKFEIEDNLNVTKWEIEGQANSNDKKTEILLRIINSFLNQPDDFIELNGILFRFKRIDFVIEYVSKLKIKKTRKILKLLDVKPKTIYSYLRIKQIQEFKKRRKNFYRRIDKDSTILRKIFEILRKKIIFNNQYTVDLVINDLDKYKEIIDIANKNKLSKTRIKYLDLIKDYKKFNRIIDRINKDELHESPVNIKNIVKDKFFLISNIISEKSESKTTFKVTVNDGELNLAYDYLGNLDHDTSMEVIIQLISKFKGNPNIPVLIANIPLRFQLEDFIDSYGRYLSPVDVRKLLKLFKCNPRTIGSLVDKHKKQLRGAESNPFNW